MTIVSRNTDHLCQANSSLKISFQKFSCLESVFSAAKMSKEEEIMSGVGAQQTSQPTSKTASVEEKEARNGRENKVRKWFRQIYEYLEFTRAYKFVLCMHPQLQINRGRVGIKAWLMRNSFPLRRDIIWVFVATIVVS